MNRNEIITHYYNDKGVNECLVNLCPQHQRSDLKQYIFLQLLEKEEGEIIAMHWRGELRFFIVRIILNCTRGNKRNEFNRQMNDSGIEITELNHSINPYEQIAEIEIRRERERLMDDCKEAAAKLPHPYYEILLNKYAELGSYRKVADLIGIPLVTVFDAVKKAKEQVKEKLK